MLCYKDRTYCPFHLLCKKGYTCKRALTDKVRRGAIDAKLPVSQFVEFPDCFDVIWGELKK